MDVNELPLQELFTRLREAGLPLGVGEYQLVLQSLQAGFGMTDKVALKRLCQTLWIKSAEEKRIFEYHFEQVMGSKAVLPTLETLATQSRQRKLSQITRYVALAGASIITGIIISGVGFSMGKNQNQTTNRTDQLQAPGVDNDKTRNSGTNTSSDQTTQTNLTPTQSNRSAITQFVVLSFGVVLVSGTALTTVYTVTTWVGKQFSKQRVSDDNSISHTTTTISTSDISSLTQPIEDEVQVAQAVLQATSWDKQISHGGLTLFADYLPVTQRQMKQIWRYLRRMIREGQPTELDIEATVNQIGRQGTLLKAVIVPRRVNRTELLLLIDQDGSMVPFHSLSQRLAETAQRGGRLGQSSIYYFHNCPVEHLYHDLNHQYAELIHNILAQLHKERTVVLIFSDAGAARGGLNPERLAWTEAFLKQLKQCVHYVAWLNPMPQSRWSGTTAGEIAHLVPMFEVSRRGLQDAIDVLRGRSTNFEEQKK